MVHIAYVGSRADRHLDFWFWRPAEICDSAPGKGMEHLRSESLRGDYARLSGVHVTVRAPVRMPPKRRLVPVPVDLDGYPGIASWSATRMRVVRCPDVESDSPASHAPRAPLA